MKYKYTAKPLFYVLVASIVLAVFIPILIPVVLGIWFLVALINFGNRALKG
jgi:lipopolysaccharide/colanic/teichoic acid biosynthesis glycosyltransferase